ncbi:DUF6049 family protein, partial [Bacillus subtilis]|uniref:DUF6049 family protein n=1 Tax=Bacillus subtilis TaxID=1423 RepID=UPI003C1DB730
TPGEDLTVTVAAVNPSDAAVEAGAVRLTTSTTPLDSRDAVTGWLAETDEGAVATAVELATAELPGIAAHSRDAVTTEIDADDLDGLSPGVYPL